MVDPQFSPEELFQSIDEPASGPRRGRQFSLAGLFVLVTGVGLLLGIVQQDGQPFIESLILIVLINGIGMLVGAVVTNVLGFPDDGSLGLPDDDANCTREDAPPDRELER